MDTVDQQLKTVECQSTVFVSKLFFPTSGKGVRFFFSKAGLLLTPFFPNQSTEQQATK